MATTHIEIRELPQRFDELLALAQAGHEVVVTEKGVPRARLVPLPAPPRRTPGLHRGAITTSEELDAPLPEEFWTGKQ
jgi:prevent-host-death family protein